MKISLTFPKKDPCGSDRWKDNFSNLWRCGIRHISPSDVGKWRKLSDGLSNEGGGKMVSSFHGRVRRVSRLIAVQEEKYQKV